MRKFDAGKFPARVLHNRTLGSFFLAETFYQSGQIIEKHSHNEPGFIIVLKGQFLETQSRENRICKYTDVIFRPAGHLHGDSFESDSTRCFNFQFRPAWLSRLQVGAKEVLSSNPAYFAGGGVLFQLGLKLYKEFRTPDDDSLLVVEGLALEMIGTANRLLPEKQESSVPLWMKRVLSRLQDNFGERVTVQELALEAGVHPVYLARAFRKRFGQSVGEYLRRLRLEFCCKQLALTDFSIAEISTAAGFYDQGHLSRAFKRFSGMTPLAYRKIFRKV